MQAMSCTRRNQTSAATASDASRRAGSTALSPIVEERLLDTDENSVKNVDDEAGVDECCRCCCLRRDLEAPPAWRDLDIHGVRCMLRTRRRQRGCVGAAVRRYYNAHLTNNKLRDYNPRLRSPRASRMLAARKRQNKRKALNK